MDSGWSICHAIDALQIMTFKTGWPFHKSGMTHNNLVNLTFKRPANRSVQKLFLSWLCKYSFQSGYDEYPYPVESMDMTYDGLHPPTKVMKWLQNAVEDYEESINPFILVPYRQQFIFSNTKNKIIKTSCCRNYVLISLCLAPLSMLCQFL